MNKLGPSDDVVQADDHSDGPLTPTADSESGLVLVEHPIEGGVRLVVSGEIDQATVDEFRRALTTIVGRGDGDVELDMRGVTFVDSQGLRALVTARQIGMYVFRELTDYSYPKIAQEFGGRDHTTVMHAVDKITAQMAEKRQTLDQVNELISRIKLGTGG